jgi:glycosyltransferase involved in cell wall biosynthesis
MQVPARRSNGPKPRLIMAKAGPGPDISVVIAAHNEVENIAPMCAVLKQLLSPLGRYEIIFVEDGSIDGTLEAIRAAARDPSVRYVSLTRNFGHEACLRAGLRHADGRAVIVMDADFEHPPELIPELVKQWRTGFKIVAAKRLDDEASTSFLKRLTSRLYYRVFDTLGDVRIEPGSANYLLMDRIVVDAINDLQDQELFLRGVVRWFGYSLTTIQYRPGARKHGATKYSLRRSLELAVTGIASHSIRPLRAAIWLSLSFALVGGLLVVYSIVSFLFIQHTAGAPGWASIMAAIAILGAVQLLVLGIIGEYVGRILRETRRRPRYVIAETEAAQGDQSKADRDGH